LVLSRTSAAQDVPTALPADAVTDSQDLYIGQAIELCRRVLGSADANAGDRALAPHDSPSHKVQLKRRWPGDAAWMPSSRRPESILNAYLHHPERTLRPECWRVCFRGAAPLGSRASCDAF
jgi:hypothetical protein